jgi:hypothetical protein
MSAENELARQLRQGTSTVVERPRLVRCGGVYTATARRHERDGRGDGSTEYPFDDPSA